MALLTTAITLLQRGSPFRPYFGAVPPLLAVAIVAGVGALALGSIARATPLRTWSGPWQPGAASIPVLLALGLPIIPIVADLAFRFPLDLNVPWPASLTFYPAIGFVAEIVFHIVPLAALVLGLQAVTHRPPSGATLRACLLAVALLEPAFQVLRITPGPNAMALRWVVGLHVLVFNLAALWTFVRLDFVAMYGFRVLYYAVWHIAWGQARLALLFPRGP